MNYIDQVRKQVEYPKIVPVLSLDMMWQEHGVIIWQAEKFEGKPVFYPAYNYKNYYSYSLLALIVKKKSLVLSKQAYNAASKSDFSILPNETLIDSDIVRIGGLRHFGDNLCDTDEYCMKFADALKKDIALIERSNPGFTNVILCGGKDSLNLLLLPWQNPVVVYSAEPNFLLVQDFVKDNSLAIEVRKLEDTYSEEHLADEILELCCRVDSRHWRWAKHIRDISEDYSKKIVIWKGQMGDVFCAPNWKTYIYPETQPKLFLCKFYKKLSPFMPQYLSKRIGNIIIRDVELTHWNKGSISQGVHMAFMRSLADCLVVSAYHGKNVTEVLSKVNLPSAVQTDIRGKLGNIIHGREVIYPLSNPSPGLSDMRKGAHEPDKFIKLLRKNDIEIK